MHFDGTITNRDLFVLYIFGITSPLSSITSECTKKNIPPLKLQPLVTNPKKSLDICEIPTVLGVLNKVNICWNTEKTSTSKHFGSVL
jgi:hypothetical protein